MGSNHEISLHPLVCSLYVCLEAFMDLLLLISLELFFPLILLFKCSFLCSLSFVLNTFYSLFSSSSKCDELLCAHFLTLIEANKTVIVQWKIIYLILINFTIFTFLNAKNCKKFSIRIRKHYRELSQLTSRPSEQ